MCEYRDKFAKIIKKLIHHVLYKSKSLCGSGGSWSKCTAQRDELADNTISIQVGVDGQTILPVMLRNEEVDKGVITEYTKQNH